MIHLRLQQVKSCETWDRLLTARILVPPQSKKGKVSSMYIHTSIFNSCFFPLHGGLDVKNKLPFATPKKESLRIIPYLKERPRENWNPGQCLSVTPSPLQLSIPNYRQDKTVWKLIQKHELIPPQNSQMPFNTLFFSIQPEINTKTGAWLWYSWSETCGQVAILRKSIYLWSFGILSHK